MSAAAPAPRTYNSKHLNSKITIIPADNAELEYYNNFYFTSEGIGKRFFDTFRDIAISSIVVFLNFVLQSNEFKINGGDFDLVVPPSAGNIYINIVPKVRPADFDILKTPYEIEFKLNSKTYKMTVHNFHFSFHRIPGDKGLDGRLHLKFYLSDRTYPLFIRFIPFHSKGGLKFSYVVHQDLTPGDSTSPTHLSAPFRTFFTNLAEAFIIAIENSLAPAAAAATSPRPAPFTPKPTGAAAAAAATTPPVGSRSVFSASSLSKVKDAEKEKITARAKAAANAAAAEAAAKVVSNRIAASAARRSAAAATAAAAAAAAAEEEAKKAELIATMNATEAADPYKEEKHIAAQIEYITYLQSKGIANGRFKYTNIMKDNGKSYIVFRLNRENTLHVFHNGSRIDIVVSHPTARRTVYSKPRTEGGRRTRRNRKNRRNTRRQ